MIQLYKSQHTISGYKCPVMKQVKLDTLKFTGGERHIYVHNMLNDSKIAMIHVDYESSDDIIDLILLVDAIRRIAPKIEIGLCIPYFPYARQDRVCNTGESHSLKAISNIINSLKLDIVVSFDPHSNVMEATIDNFKQIHQAEILSKYINTYGFDLQDDLVLLSPDYGASKKIEKIKEYSSRVYKICNAYKTRNSDNSISLIRIDNIDMLKGKHVLVVDDICDGGRTFLALADYIKKNVKTRSLSLFVTHGIFSHNSKPKLLEEFDAIYCEFDRTNKRNHDFHYIMETYKNILTDFE